VCPNAAIRGYNHEDGTRGDFYFLSDIRQEFPVSAESVPGYREVGVSWHDACARTQESAAIANQGGAS
jgi:hypothetical protein